MLYRVYTYDVWGNEEDGFDINDIFRTRDTVEIRESPTKPEIIKALKAEGLLKKGLRYDRVDLDWPDEIMYIKDAKNGRPEFELRPEGSRSETEGPGYAAGPYIPAEDRGPGSSEEDGYRQGFRAMDLLFRTGDSQDRKDALAEARQRRHRSDYDMGYYEGMEERYSAG